MLSKLQEKKPDSEKPLMRSLCLSPRHLRRNLQAPPHKEVGASALRTQPNNVSIFQCE